MLSYRKVRIIRKFIIPPSKSPRAIRLRKHNIRKPSQSELKLANRAIPDYETPQLRICNRNSHVRSISIKLEAASRTGTRDNFIVGVAFPSRQFAAKKQSKTVTIGAYPRRIIPVRRLCPIETFILPFLPFFHSHLVIYLFFLGVDNELPGSLYRFKLARDAILNLRWNSSELPQLTWPVFSV